ncbi:MAG: hypothetical protein BGP12_12435 [Rhodospirillales bacterium 70-18]|nr:MAG: hypothetical protein BGP12_12435 [Rhodospirillales bacterium 70-18]
MFNRIARYEEHGFGLPYPVVILNAVEEELDEKGARVGVRIPNIEGLAAAVALGRCFDPYELGGAEVRFLRRTLGYTQKELAGHLEIRPETLSRWEGRKENADQRPVGEWADKALRMLAVLDLAPRVPGVTVDPKSITGLRIRLRNPNQWPTLTAEQVIVKTDSHKRYEWDAVHLPMAA